MINTEYIEYLRAIAAIGGERAASAQAELLKYSADQERDDHGRFSSEGKSDKEVADHMASVSGRAEHAAYMKENYGLKGALWISKARDASPKEIKAAHKLWIARGAKGPSLATLSIMLENKDRMSNSLIDKKTYDSKMRNALKYSQAGDAAVREMLSAKSKSAKDAANAKAEAAYNRAAQILFSGGWTALSGSISAVTWGHHA